MRVLRKTSIFFKNLLHVYLENISLTLRTLDKIFSRQHIEIFFLCGEAGGGGEGCLTKEGKKCVFKPASWFSKAVININS